MGIRINNRAINVPKNFIDYTARDFDTIKQRLVEYVKVNYPDTYQDFNASSFGSLMFDLVSYVGDQLAFYTDYIAAESNLVTAQEENSVRDLAEEHGAEFDLAARVSTTLEMILSIPADANGQPDSTYLDGVLHAGDSSPFMLLATESGQTFTLDNDITIQDVLVDFTNTEVAEIDGSKVKVFLAKLSIPVTSGQIAQQSTVVGVPTRSPIIEVRHPNVSGIVSVTDSEGNEYHQLDSLTSNSMLKSIPNISDTNTQVSSIMRPEAVMRRFVVRKRRGKTFLEFSFGSANKIKEDAVADPSNLAIKMSGKSTLDGTRSVDPTKLVSNDKLGVSPINTTLTIKYKYNEKSNVNVAAGACNQVLSTGMTFKSEHLLNPSYIKYVRDSIRVRNPNPINGDVSMMSTNEMKHRHRGAFAAQKRAVTLQDYAAAVYAMPPRYGKIKRATVIRDDNDFRRNLNMYIIAEGPDGKLQAPTPSLYANLKTFLNTRRMISDSVDLFPAYIVNLGIEYDIVAEGNTSRERLTGPLRDTLYKELTMNPPEIGEHFNISKVWSIIQNFPGVSMVRSVNLVSKAGTGYEGNLYDTRGKLRPMESLKIDPDHIWEIKRPSDIVMKQYNGKRNY